MNCHMNGPTLNKIKMTKYEFYLTNPSIRVIRVIRWQAISASIYGKIQKGHKIKERSNCIETKLYIL